MMNIPSVLKLIVAALFLSILPVLGYALTPDHVFNKVKDSIVVVKTLDAQGKVIGQGSGVLLPSGKIATNCHVVEGGRSYLVRRGKELAYGTLYAEDADKDICLLDAKGITGKPAQIGKAAGLKVGDPVYAVGAPQGLELSLSDGIVAQLRGGPPPIIQTTAAISPGSSGGGLFDGEGRLVGLTTLYLEGGQSLNFAIPVEWIGEVKPGRKTVAEGRRLVGIEEKRSKISQAAADTKTIVTQTMLFYNDKAKYPNGLVTGNAATGLYDAGYVASIIDPFSTAQWPANIYQYALNGAAVAGQTNANMNDDIRAWSIGPDNTSGTADDIGFSNQTGAFGPARKPAAGEHSQTEWSKRADALEQMKDWRRLLDWCLKWTKSEPKNAEAWFYLGYVYEYLKRDNDAIEAYRQVIRIEPENAKAWISLGNAYAQLDRYNDAIEACSQAIRINPENADAWCNLGIAYFLSDNRAAALDAVQKLRRLDPERADKLFNLIVPR